MVDLGDLLLVGGVVAEVDDKILEDSITVYLATSLISSNCNEIISTITCAAPTTIRNTCVTKTLSLFEIDELCKFLGGVRSVSSDLEDLLVGVVGERLDGVGFLVEWEGSEDVNFVVFVKVEEDGLFVILGEVREHFVNLKLNCL